MAWIIGSVALGLVITALTLAELRRPDLTIGDRVIAIFALVTFTVALVNGVVLLATLWTWTTVTGL